MQVALALYPGVSADECEAFTCVFDLLDGAELVGVGASVGAVEGPGGGHRIDATFADVQHPDVVLVPGGIGCARAAGDEPLLDWLRTVAPRSTWTAASSTGIDSSRSTERATRAARAPPASSCRATTSPIPRLAPVTTARFPLKSKAIAAR